MPTLQELESPIEQRIASALVEATPDSWKKACLEVEATDDAAGLGMSHTISSPEGRHEVVSLTDEILEATFELRELFRKHGKAWRRVVFEINVETGTWHYAARFAY